VSYIIATGFVGHLDPENKGVAVGISLLSILYAGICETTIYEPPTWIYDFRLYLKIVTVALLD